MLRWRLLLGTFFVAVVAALGWADLQSAQPGIWLFPLAVVVSLAASGELLWMTRQREARPLAWVVCVGNLLIVVSNWLPHFAVLGSTDVWAFPSLAFAVGLILAFGGEMLHYEKPGGVTERIALAVLSLAYVGVLLSFVIQLRFLHGGAWGIPALASLIVVVKMGNIGAYTVGRLFGRHRMAPVLSPGKTWEGAAGGILFACVGAWLALGLLLPALVPEGSRPQPMALGWLWFGILVGLAGMLGDLAESLFKRDLGCKDSSPWMPGFGGVLDILDSILLARPGRLWLLDVWACCIVSLINTVGYEIRPGLLALPAWNEVEYLRS